MLRNILITGGAGFIGSTLNLPLFRKVSQLSTVGNLSFWIDISKARLKRCDVEIKLQISGINQLEHFPFKFLDIK